MMMKSDDYILSYVNHFKSIIDNDLEREVFSYLAEREEQNLDGHIKEIHQYLCKKYKNLSKNDIEEAMKNLIIKRIYKSIHLKHSAMKIVIVFFISKIQKIELWQSFNFQKYIL